jgi:hypothetical protein
MASTTQAEAEARALQAELARLRARTEIDVLRDEVAQMRAEQMAVLKACHLARLPLQEIPLHAFGELDISVKSSKEELATARGEIAELKALVCALIGTVTEPPAEKKERKNPWLGLTKEQKAERVVKMWRRPRQETSTNKTKQQKKQKKIFYCRFHQIDLVKLNETAPQWIPVPEKQQQLKCPLLPI